MQGLDPTTDFVEFRSLCDPVEKVVTQSMDLPGLAQKYLTKTSR
jgi:hypothetical protein